jgi:DNA-directed RNA polymerase beta subunit
MFRGEMKLKILIFPLFYMSSADFNWEKDTWGVIDKFFEDPDTLIQHQLDSYNNLIETTLPLIVQQGMPLKIFKDNPSGVRFEFEVLRVYFTKPLTHEDEVTRPLLPYEARLRDMTYSGCIFIDIQQTFNSTGDGASVSIERKLPLCRFPIMVGSKYCHLHGRSPEERVAMGECRYDRGGYFIVNGSEKVLIGQERPVDNKVICHKGGGKKKDTKYVARAEIKSTIDQRFHPIKACAVYISAPPSATTRQAAEAIPGQKIRVGIPYIKHEVPLFVMFRALGVISDKLIFEHIFGNPEALNEGELSLLIPSINEALHYDIRTQYDAIKYISSMVNYTPPKDIDLRDPKYEEKDGEALYQADILKDKMKHTVDILNREFLPHVGPNHYDKAHFLGYMTRKIINAYITDTYSDRDHYSNKRVNVTGPLLAQIFRSSYLKLIKEIKDSYMQMLLSGSTGKNTKLRRIIQKCSMESRIKYALATGNWITTRASAASSTKTGIAQVLQRLSRNGTISHVRRLQSPLEKDGSKQEAPRRYHATQIGKICPNETPEGQQVGIVKNMALLCGITTDSNYQPILYLLSKIGVIPLKEFPLKHTRDGTLVFVNGRIAGITPVGDTEEDSMYNTNEIYKLLKKFKITGKISPYTSISWDRLERELQIYTDGGRYYRPLYIVDQEDYRLKITKHWRDLKTARWHSLITGDVYDREQTDILQKSGGVVEYLDTNEENESMIAIMPHEIIPSRVHVEAVSRDDRLAKEFIVPLGIKILVGRRTLKGGEVGSGLKATIVVEKEASLSDISDIVKGKIGEWIVDKYRTEWNNIAPSVALTLLDKKRSVFKFTLTDDAVESEEFNEKKTITMFKYLNRLIQDEYRTYTHCELHSAMVNSAIAQMIPYSNHNQSPRNCYQSSMGKQALGIYATNYHRRMDTASNVLVYPQKPLVQTRTTKYTTLDELPHGMQCIVAIMAYTGYNQEDSTIMNKSAVERGLFNSEYYHTYESKVQKHRSSTGAREKFGKPPAKTVGRRVGASKGDPYHAINEKTGFPVQGAYVHGGDVLIGKYTEVADESESDVYKDVSTVVRHSEGGLVDWVIPNADFPHTRNGEGFEYCKVRLTEYRTPEIGDKVASRHAQKGTIGMLYREEDMPYTASGVVPDIVMNPHAIPSRMTIGQLIEAVFSKASAVDGNVRDATPFTEPYSFVDGSSAGGEADAFSPPRTDGDDCEELIDIAKRKLANFGFDYNGNEVMYNGQTGEMFEVAIFVNPTYYQRLKHMVADKQHARNKGPVQLLTRQPAEGRSREGGLRIGEMERDGILGGGASYFLKEKTLELSDIFEEHINSETGWFANVNKKEGIYLEGKEEIPEHVQIDRVVLPFANSLFLRELRTMGISAQMKVA